MDAFPDRSQAVAGAEGAPCFKAPAVIVRFAQRGDHPLPPTAWPTRPVLRIEELARELLLKALCVLAFGETEDVEADALAIEEVSVGQSDSFSLAM